MLPIEYAERRKKFLKQIKDGVAVFPSAPCPGRSIIHHPYRQESNFYYLTGFPEPESMALLSPQNKEAFQMFVQPVDKTKERWEGPMLGERGTIKKYGADKAHPITPDNHFDNAFVEALMDAESLYYRVGLDASFDQRIFKLMEKARKKIGRSGRPLWPIHDPTDILGEMRNIKSKAEIQRIEYAAQISAEAHIHAMQSTRAGMYEYEVEALLYHTFRTRGAGRPAYPAIVGSGPNACVLHYVSNNRQLKEEDLLLIDAGAEFDQYTSDITRVFPVGGTFSSPQAEVYDAVLDAQKQTIAKAEPGRSMKELHELATEVLIDHLRRMKVLKGSTKSILQKESHRPYYPHNTGHWLGIDVHDAGKYYSLNYDNPLKLKPGMIFTVEPGLYFPPEAGGPAKYKGIGVRIEDDVLITSKGHKILSKGVPKEREEVQEVCHQTRD